MKKILQILKKQNTIPFALLAIVIASAVFEVFIFSRGIFSYDIWDYYEGVFWADASLRSFSLINPEYIYYYVLPFGSNVIMAPFVALFGTTVLANQLGMLVFLLIYLAASFHLAKALFPQNKRSRTIFLCVMSMFIYTYIGDNLLHHLLMYGIGFVCTIGELSCIIELNRGYRIRKNTILLVLYCLWSSVNGFSAALSTVPVLAAFILIHYLNKTIRKKENISLLLTMMIPTILGILLFLYLDQKAMTQNMYDRRFILDSAEGFVNHLTRDVFVDYLRLFYYGSELTILSSGKGIFMMFKLSFAVLLIAGSVFFACRERKTGNQLNNDEKMLYLSNLLISAVCLGQYLLFEVSVCRYLFNAVLSLFMVCAYLTARFFEKTDSAIGMTVLTVLILIFSIKMAFSTYPYGKEIRNEYQKICDVLNEEGIDRGYISKRQWKVVDLLSKGKISSTTIDLEKCADTICIEEDRIYPYEMYKPQDKMKFYIITNQKYYDAYPEMLAGYCKQIKVYDAYVLIYDIEKWDSMFEGKAE